MNPQSLLPKQPPQPAEPQKSKRGAPIGPEFLELPDPLLRFAPTAWAKLLFFRDVGQTEIGGFGITAADDLLRIEEFVTVRQEVTFASISFDDLAVADFFETQVDAGRKPEQFGRIWLHTHPGNSAQPSDTDEVTFQRVFGPCQWAVMFILARSGQTYARLRFNVGPGGEVLIPVEVDYRQPFGPSAFEAWKAEYQANVKAAPPAVREHFGAQPFLDEELWAGRPFPDEWLQELAAMDPAERQLYLDELVEWPEAGQEESEASCEPDQAQQAV